MNDNPGPHRDKLPLEVEQQIDQLSDEFERAWKAGRAPRIEDYLDRVADVGREALLQELLVVEFELWLQMDETLDVDSYRQRFADCETVVEAALAAHERRRRCDEMSPGKTPNNEPLDPTYIGRFEIQRQLGRGGFGVVYLARDPGLDRLVAIKVPRADLLATAQQRDSFLLEARTAAQLKHPGLVVVYDVQQDENQIFIVQEYIDGQNLAEWAAAQTRSWEDLTRRMIEIATAIGYVHQEGIYHRDLKPGNILIDKKGRAHVADFGMAVHEDAVRALKRQAAGTPHYMSPEQIRGVMIDNRTDIWALGVILYELLTGQRPFTADEPLDLYEDIQELDPKSPRVRNPEVPRELERICFQCLAKQRTHRYLTAADLIDDLEVFLATCSESTRVSEGPQKAEGRDPPTRSSPDKAQGATNLASADGQPCVQLKYQLPSLGEEHWVELPFVTGVLADLSGTGSAEVLPKMDYRRFVEIDSHNFAEVFEQSAPRVTFTVPSLLTNDRELDIDLCFDSLDDFSPTAVAKRIPQLSTVLENRTNLVRMDAFLDANPHVADVVDTMIRCQRISACSNGIEPNFGQSGESEIRCQQLDTMLDKHSAGSRSVILGAVESLKQYAQQPPFVAASSTRRLITLVVRHLDRRLSEQVNLIIHREEFQRLHGTWLGLRHLVDATAESRRVKIRVLNVTKRELGKSLEMAVEFDQSPLFRKVYNDEYDTPGGQPFGLLVGDFYFNHAPDDVSLLRHMSMIAAAAWMPFVAAASPSLLALDSWTELNRPRELALILSTTQYKYWHSLRASEDARFLALLLPRFLGRLPFESKLSSTESFRFEEEIDFENLTWVNPVYAFAATVHRSFAKYGWCSSIGGVETGGLVQGVPSFNYETIRRTLERAGPTEVDMGDRRGQELADIGLIPLYRMRHGTNAVFKRATSLHRSAGAVADDATQTCPPSELPDLLNVARLVHHVKCIVRDHAFTCKEDAELWLNGWLRGACVPLSENQSTACRVHRPLLEASVRLKAKAGSPGLHWCELHVRVHGISGDVAPPVQARFPIVTR